MSKEEFLQWMDFEGIDLEEQGIRIGRPWEEWEIHGTDAYHYTVEQIPETGFWEILSYTEQNGCKVRMAEREAVVFQTLYNHIIKMEGNL